LLVPLFTKGWVLGDYPEKEVRGRRSEVVGVIIKTPETIDREP
jgi:hypothetical protein